jgi:hypothetical protein
MSDPPKVVSTTHGADTGAGRLSQRCNKARGTFRELDESFVWLTVRSPTAEMNDCNGNGVPDGCDITDGFSEDADSNGFPDECQCPDTDASGTVGTNDLMNVVLDWAPMARPTAATWTAAAWSTPTTSRRWSWRGGRASDNLLRITWSSGARSSITGVWGYP